MTDTLHNPGYVHNFRVGLHDTDAAGVLFFAQLFRHAHEAYEAFMAHIGFPLPEMIRQGEYHLPLVSAQANYLAKISHGDDIQVTVQVAQISKRSFSMAYAFTVGRSKTAAHAKTVHVLIAHPDQNTAAPPVLPQALRIALARYQQPPPATD